MLHGNAVIQKPELKELKPKIYHQGRPGLWRPWGFMMRRNRLITVWGPQHYRFGNSVVSVSVIKFPEKKTSALATVLNRRMLVSVLHSMEP